MRAIVALCIVMIPLLSTCVSSNHQKSTETESMKMESNQVQRVDKLVYNEGIESRRVANAHESDTIIRLILDLLAVSETMRLYIEDEELDALLGDMKGFGFEFSPSLLLNGDENRLTRVFFLTSGKFAVQQEDSNVIFFIYLDGEFIRSPFRAENSRELYEILGQLAGYME